MKTSSTLTLLVPATLLVSCNRAREDNTDSAGRSLQQNRCAGIVAVGKRFICA